MPETIYPNWFEQNAKANFEKFLPMLLKQSGVRLLQLGVYTGDASLWLAKNILKDNTSFLIDVDTWKGSNEDAHRDMDFDDVYNTYLKKVEGYKQIIPKRSTTLDFLVNSGHYNNYDFIYIDADHTTVGVLIDAELSWRILEVGGIMAFDDYTWGAELPPELSPTLGIDLFLSRHEGEYETLVVNEQYWIRKK
jgi:predicted O-methyltransferase YrrM